MKSNKGNILFLILIAVALFAALSYAITGSSRSGGATISQDKARLAAAEILQYATAMEQAVTKLKVINGCGDNEISFQNNYYPVNTTNPRAPSDFSCHVFHANGGGMAYRVWPQDWMAAQSGSNQDTTVQYQTHTAFIGTGKYEGVGVEEYAEIAMVVPWLKDEICEAINDLVRGPNVVLNPQEGYWFLQHLGSNTIREPPMHIDPEAKYRSRCAKYENGASHVLTNINTFGHVLLAR